MITKSEHARFAKKLKELDLDLRREIKENIYTDKESEALKTLNILQHQLFEIQMEDLCRGNKYYKPIEYCSPSPPPPPPPRDARGK